MTRGVLAGSRCATVALTLLIFQASAAAQDVVLDLSLPASSKVVTLQVPADGGSMPLTLVKTGTKAATVKVAVTVFVSEAGERLEPLVSADPASNSGRTQVTLDVRTSQFPRASLLVPPLPGPGPYTGSIFIVVDDAAPARQVVAITAAVPPRPAALQLVPETDTRVVTIRRPFWTSRYEPGDRFNPDLGPTFDLRFGDAAARWTVKDLAVGPATVTKAPDGFSFSDRVAFYDEQGKRISLPTSVPASSRTVRLQLGGLTAGEYHVTVPFFGANAGAEPRKFALIVYARHHVGYAVLCLVVALLLSFFASKLVAVRSERIRLVDRITDLRPFWLQEEPPTLAVVWIQSIVTQATQLSERRLLPSLDTIHTRLDKAQALVQTLDGLRRVRLEIRQSVLPRFAKARALKVAQRIGDRLDPEMGPAELADVTAAITDLRGWTRQGESHSRYAADLAGSISQLLADVDPEALAPDHRAAVVALVEQVKKDLPTSPAELEERERRYATLKIIWERRRADEFPELLALHDAGVDQVFQKADESAWKRLVARQDRLRIELISHKNASAPEAYDPLTFRFTAGDPALDATFLVMHGITYDWKFVLGADARPLSLAPLTKGPYVPVFAPFSGKMRPSVTLAFHGDVLKVDRPPVGIARSRRFHALKSFSSGEVLQLAIAFAAAVITGLQTFYYKSQSFGSLADYMALFAWGATIDQVKNFLQRLPSAPSVTTPVPPSTVSAPTVAAAIGSPPVPTAPAVEQPQANAGVGGLQGGATPAPMIPNPARPQNLPLGNGGGH